MSTQQLSQTKAKRIVAELTRIGDQLEAADDPRWYEIARAAATLEALRLGVLTVEPHLTLVEEVAA